MATVRKNPNARASFAAAARAAITGQEPREAGAAGGKGGANDGNQAGSNAGNATVATTLMPLPPGGPRRARRAATTLPVSAGTPYSPQTGNLVRHLLWHKAMIPDDDDGSRIDALIQVVTHADDGEHVSIRDPFHRDIAIAFELVMKEELDPWDLDLSKFAAMYLKEAADRKVDIETAGRIILMAWTVLKLQSDDVAERAVFAPAPIDETPGWEDLPTWEFAEGLDYAQRVLSLPQAPIDEKIRHKGDRRVTLMELIGAFEEVHQEAEARKVLVQQKLEARLSLRRRMRGRVGGMMHKEDLAAELFETWTRILESGQSPVPFSLLHERSAMDLVQTFVSLLILVKDGRVTVSQEEFPRGEIWVSPTEKGLTTAPGPETPQGVARHSSHVGPNAIGQNPTVNAAGVGATTGTARNQSTTEVAA